MTARSNGRTTNEYNEIDSVVSKQSLPAGWRWVTLGMIAEVKGGLAKGQKRKAASSLVDVPYLRVANVQRGFLNLSEVKVIPATAEEIEELRLKPNDILFNEGGDRDKLGRGCVWSGEIENCIHQNHVFRARLNSELVDPQYVSWYGNSVAQAYFLSGGKQTTNLASLNLSTLKALPIPMPPMAEQQRIVRKVRAILQKYRSIKSEVDLIPEFIQRFRRSVLEAAISGRLTENWRAKHNRDLSSWLHESAESVCEKVQSGSTPKEGFTQEAGIPFLKVYNIVNQTVDFAYRPQFVSSDIHRGRLARSRTIPGDVIMNIVGPPLGKVAIVPGDFQEWNINQAITLFRPSKKLLGEWLYFFLRSGESISDIIHETRGSAGQVNISLSQCRSFILPVPPLDEQKELIRLLSIQMAFADALDNCVATLIQKLDSLPTSVFNKAFRGELVEQDPRDDPFALNGSVNGVARDRKLVKA